MERLQFELAMEDIFAIFGKKTPTEKVLDIIYKRIEFLPPDFMDFVVRHFEDQLDLPKNMGLYIMRTLWPLYLDKHPELRAKEDYGSCPNCLEGSHGWRRVWQPAFINGAHTYLPQVIRCPCGNAPNPNYEYILTDRDLLSLGWRLEMPFRIWKPGLPESWLKKVLPSQDLPPYEEKAEEDFVSEPF